MSLKGKLFRSTRFVPYPIHATVGVASSFERPLPPGYLSLSRHKTSKAKMMFHTVWVSDDCILKTWRYAVGEAHFGTTVSDGCPSPVI